MNMKTKKNIIVVGDRVLIDPDEGSEKTASGLYLGVPEEVPTSG